MGWSSSLIFNCGLLLNSTVGPPSLFPRDWPIKLWKTDLYFLTRDLVIGPISNLGSSPLLASSISVLASIPPSSKRFVLESTSIYKKRRKGFSLLDMIDNLKGNVRKHKIYPHTLPHVFTLSKMSLYSTRVPLKLMLLPSFVLTHSPLLFTSRNCTLESDSTNYGKSSGNDYARLWKTRN